MANEYLTAYWLDKNDLIERVSLFWDEFALANDGGKVVASKIRGKPIWEFIGDEQTVVWLKILFESVRKRQTPQERPYRCDSPSERRYMLMRVSPMHSGALAVENILLRVEQRRHPVFFSTTPGENTEAQRILRCSICGKIKKNLAWTEPDSEADTLRLPVVYTVCEGCR